MRVTTITFTIEWAGLEFEGTASYTPGDPGRLSGPPEKCYPPEPAEVEVTSLKCEGYDALFLLNSEYGDEICVLIVEHIEEGYEDDRS